MKIIAHRGMWSHPDEKNTAAAFDAALARQYSIETDLRDMHGQLVISHDPAMPPALSGLDFLMRFREKNPNIPLAINIKSDGLHTLMAQALAGWSPEDYFLFDMSIPDTLGYLRQGLSVYLRCSEYEIPAPKLLPQARGIWLDAFEEEWYDPATIEPWTSQGKAVCIVSPELHRRAHQTHWAKLKAWGLGRHPLLSLCTDYPDAAHDYFNSQDEY